MERKISKDTLRAWQARDIKIIAIAGKRRTGKDILQNHIRGKFPTIPQYRIADAPTEIARILRIEPSREAQHALFGVNALLFGLLGESAFKRRVSLMLKEDAPPIALIAALRTEEEYYEFVTKWGGILIGLRASFETLHDRARSAARTGGEKRDEAELTFQAFMGDPVRGTGEYHPIEREIEGIVARAHIIIENNFDTLEPFHAKIDEALDQLELSQI